MTGIFETLVNDIVKDLDIDLSKPYYKDLIGFQDKYTVDINNGLVYQKTDDGLVLKEANPNSIGYCYVRLNDVDGGTRSYPVHQVVMAAMLEMQIGEWKKFGFNEVNHKKVGEEYRSFNAWWNLELDTRSGNMQKARKSHNKRRLTKDEVRQLREEFKSVKKNKMDWYFARAAELGCSYTTVQYNVLGFYNKAI